MNSTDPMSESTSLNLDHTDSASTTASTTAERIRNSRDYHVLNAMLGLLTQKKAFSLIKIRKQKSFTFRVTCKNTA